MVVYIRSMSMPIIWVRIHIGINCMSDIYIYIHNELTWVNIMYHDTYICMNRKYRVIWVIRVILVDGAQVCLLFDTSHLDPPTNVPKCGRWHVQMRSWRSEGYMHLTRLKVETTGSIRVKYLVPSMNRTNRTNRHGKTSLDIFDTFWPSQVCCILGGSVAGLVPLNSGMSKVDC